VGNFRRICRNHHRLVLPLKAIWLNQAKASEEKKVISSLPKIGEWKFPPTK